MTVTTIGLLGASTIAPAAVVLPAADRADVAVTVVAARERTRAEAFAARWGVPRAAPSYAALLDDPAVDVVYVSTAVSDHARWVVAALDAGKDVLVEKPAAVTVADALAMTTAAERSGRLLLEGFHDQWHPLAAEVRRLVTAEGSGAVEHMTATVLGHRPSVPGSVLHEPALGGGALRHSGCYAVHWMRTLLGTEPSVTSAVRTQGPSGSDEESVLDLAFPGGVTGRVVSSFARDATPDDPPHLVVRSATGRLEVDGLVVPHLGHRLRVGTAGGPWAETVVQRTERTSYDHQLDALLAARHDPHAIRRLREDLLGQAVVLADADAAAS